LKGFFEFFFETKEQFQLLVILPVAEGFPLCYKASSRLSDSRCPLGWELSGEKIWTFFEWGKQAGPAHY
jgi:hypothetical protein